MSTNECSTQTAIASPSGRNVRRAIATSTAPYSREADQSELGQELQRRRVRLDDGERARAARMRSVSRTCRPPVPCAGWSVNAFQLLPPAPAVCSSSLDDDGLAGCVELRAAPGSRTRAQRSLDHCPGPPRARTEATARARRQSASANATILTTAAFTGRA
jgi:hypothetical protein